MYEKNVGMPADKEEGERPIYSLLVHCLGELLGHESFELGSEVFFGVGELDILFPISSQRRQGTYKQRNEGYGHHTKVIFSPR